MRAAVATALSLAGLALAPAVAPAAETRVLSEAPSGESANSRSQDVALSGDGRFAAFVSAASNLDGGLRGGAALFVRDNLSRAVTRIASGGSPELSANGRIVLYRALASRLRVHDRWTGRTRTLPTRRAGVPASRMLLADHALSDDGRFVAYATAKEHWSGDSLAYAVYRYDVRTRRVRRLTPFVVDVSAVAVSATGRHVAFATRAYTRDVRRIRPPGGVYVHDVRRGVTRRVDRSSSGRVPDAPGFEPDVSADGRVIAFTSRATNLVAGTVSRDYRVYVHDRRTRRTRLMSPRSGAEAGLPAISADGRRVAFRRGRPGAPLGGNAGPVGDVYLRDRLTGDLKLVSVTRAGAPSGRSGFPAISADGRWVAFASAGDDLVEDDANGFPDVFVRGPYP